MKKGFTLIELSIVLVIVGLLIGGILIGQSLIESARANSILSEWKQYEVMVNLYKSKFKSLPGDDPYAYNKFGSVCGTNDFVENGGGLGCNGNGDGTIAYIAEGRRAWHHLRLASIAEGTKILTPHSAYYNALDPKLKINKRNEWTFYHTGGGNYQPKNCRNSLIIGPFSGALVIYSANFVRAIDGKGDDGKPNTGLIEGKSNGQPCKSGNNYTNTDEIVCTVTFCLTTN